MKKIITLTENDIRNIVKDILEETKAIRPWTDDDYRKRNPLQAKDVDFAAIKKYDEDNANLLGGKVYNSAPGMYGNPSRTESAKLQLLQKRLTKDIQKRYMDATGRDKPIIPYEEIGRVGGENLQKLLQEKGLELTIAGADENDKDENKPKTFKAFSYGNQKLPEDTMIVNITSAWNCPSYNNCALGQKIDCYGMKGERSKPNVQLRNLKLQHAYKYMTVKDIVTLVEAYIESAPVRIKRIRISEEGDFPNQETVDFCDKLAGHLKAKYGIVTAAYTNNPLDYSGVKNMIINGSKYNIKNCTRYFRALPPKIYEQIPEGLVLEPYQLPVNKLMLNTENGTFKCHCDCRVCNFCYNTKEENGEPEDFTVTVGEEIRKK